MRIWRATAIAILAAIAAACSASDAADGPDARVRVATVVFPLAEAAQRVGGERVRVTNITRPGAEPHDVELGSRQVDTLEDADVVLYIGGDFQPAVREVVERRETASLDVLDAVPGARRDQDGDPHVWLDPRLMVRVVDRIETALVEARPEDRATFAANAAAYRNELTALDREIEQSLGSCRRKQLVTSHAAFHYLATRYGLTELPIAGLSPESEPDPRRAGELVDRIRAEGVTTIFTEPLVSSEVAEALAREAGVATASLNPLEGLTEEERGRGETYLSIMRANAATLRRALDCS